MSLKYSSGQLPKIGDTVKLIDRPKVSSSYRRQSGRYQNVNAGKTYKVTDVITSSRNVLITVSGGGGAMKASNFLLVVASNEPKVEPGNEYNVIVMNSRNGLCTPLLDLCKAEIFITKEISADCQKKFTVFSKLADVSIPTPILEWEYISVSD